MNTAIGDLALSNNTTGAFNIALGALREPLNYRFNNIISTSVSWCRRRKRRRLHRKNLYRDLGRRTPSLHQQFGKLGIAASSERFKDEIKPMDKASEAIFALQPVTFYYKKEIDPTRTSQFGLVAEDVEKVNPALVVRDKEGKPYSVRYDQVNAMLLNEFLKEHRKNEEQEKTIAELKSEMTALAATVKEQASQIQKVSAQLATASPSRSGLEASQRPALASGEQSLKPRPHQQKQQHFNNQPSRFIAWRLFVLRAHH